MSEFGYDPIVVLTHILVVGTSGLELISIGALPDYLRSGRRLGFRISTFGQHLESYGELTPVAGVATYSVSGHGKFNNAALVDGIPKENYSVIGIIHRRLVAAGNTPSWVTTPRAYGGPFGKCDMLEVKV